MRVPQCTPNLAGSVPRLSFSAANSAASTSSILTLSSTCINIAKPPMPKFMTPSSSQQAGQLATALQKKVTPTPITSKSVHPSQAASSSQTFPAKPVDMLKSKPLLPPTDSSEAFQKDWSSPLHGKSHASSKVRPPTGAKCSKDLIQPSSSQLFSVDGTFFFLFSSHPFLTFYFSASTCLNIIPGPDLNLQDEGSSSALLCSHKPLFLPGADDEEDHIQEDLIETSQEEVDFLGNDDDLQGQDDDAPTPPPDASMAADKEEVQGLEEASSPPPMKHCRMKPRISFVFDNLTRDFVESDPIIFLPRPLLHTDQEQKLCCSNCPQASTLNPTATYLKVNQGSKSDMRKKRKDTKGKDKVTGPTASLKHT